MAAVDNHFFTIVEISTFVCVKFFFMHLIVHKFSEHYLYQGPKSSKTPIFRHFQPFLLIMAGSFFDDLVILCITACIAANL